jgi:murein DD-endopeptidase MepM/ murein hydrolase activator NlpD
MKNSTLITITTLYGSKQYTITQLIRKFIIFFSIFLIILFISGFLMITYLNNLVTEKTELLNKKEQKITILLKKQNSLENKILVLEQNITQKQKFLDEVNDKISDIESILQIKPSKDTTTNEKLDLAKIDAVDKKYILQNIPNGYPIIFKGVTSPFGWRIHPILHKREFHPGIDLRAKRGTPVYATADAIVEYAHYHTTSGYGNLIILDHNFGFKTLFGHLSKIVVKSGKFVKKGDLIGYTGSSGLSNGPHLHYEIRYIGMVLSPKYFLKWNLKNYNYIFKKEQKVKWQSLIKAIQWQKKLLQR